MMVSDKNIFNWLDISFRYDETRVVETIKFNSFLVP